MGLTRPRAHQLQDSDFKQSVRAISTTNVTLSGGAPATVDGVSLSTNDRILVTGQSAGSENGIYRVTVVGSGSNGTWVRAVDADSTGDMTAGMVVMVTEGTSYADTSWKITTDDPITLDTTSITFVQSSAYGYGTIAVSGQSSIVADSVGDTLTVTAGNNISLTTNASTDTITVAVSDTITATGNITGGNLIATGGLSLGGTDVTATATELNYVDGVTSAIQTQLDAKGTLSNIVEDTTPQLGGALDGQAFDITTTGNVSATEFQGVATSAQYADLAEKYLADEPYKPGTVLVVGGSAEVTACSSYASSASAGVVSTNPAYLMNSSLDDVNSVELALTGRVPCRVVGSINKGDLLTTSEIEGTAIRLLPGSFVPGCIIGKALEEYNSEIPGIIEILVGKV